LRCSRPCACRRRNEQLGFRHEIFSSQPQSEGLGGTPVFRGTRVPVQTLIDYLEAGESIDAFLAGFPSVSLDRSSSFSKLRPNG
jgi:hypothetical protein